MDLGDINRIKRYLKAGGRDRRKGRHISYGPQKHPNENSWMLQVQCVQEFISDLEDADDTAVEPDAGPSISEELACSRQSAKMDGAAVTLCSYSP
ncbi:hypothetical protein CEXT_651461 [Caerostris extrusa]|uniref:Uncharacterized protein n=1 Tax=Caerostris extrusa TaxID=172846 RepID=A0AAV4T9C3_CAEEX|nr:hypothetical protein CEXT_651461 [Caerostris extrusa]